MSYPGMPVASQSQPPPPPPLTGGRRHPPSSMYEHPLTQTPRPATTTGAATAKPSLLSLVLLFSEMVQYCLHHTADGDMEGKLKAIGVRLGLRMGNLMMFRDGQGFRRGLSKKQMVSMVQQFWPTLFGTHQSHPKVAMGSSPDEWYLIDSEHVLCRFVTPPQDAKFQVGIYAAGIVEGLLKANGLECNVESYFTHSEMPEGSEEVLVRDYTATTFMIQFGPPPVQPSVELTTAETTLPPHSVAATATAPPEFQTAFQGGAAQ